MVSFGFMSFTRALGFASQSKDVIDTANRIVSRMKRDWMAIGRRPSGICGAAFVMAARLHGFKCNIEDITKVVKIGQNTIKKVRSIFKFLYLALELLSLINVASYEISCSFVFIGSNRLKFATGGF